MSLLSLLTMGEAGCEVKLDKFEDHPKSLPADMTPPSYLVELVLTREHMEW